MPDIIVRQPDTILPTSQGKIIIDTNLPGIPKPSNSISLPTLFAKLFPVIPKHMFAVLRARP